MSNDVLDSIRLGLAQSLREWLPKYGIHPTEALLDAISLRVVMDMQYQWAGQHLYVPQRSEYLERRIMSEYTGDNIPELVRRYRLATRTIYDIINRRRAKADGNGQMRLPGV